jgi:hypothetical protein
MIVNGSMPSPEEALAQLRQKQERQQGHEQEQERDRLGEPWVLLEDRAIEAVMKKI